MKYALFVLLLCLNIIQDQLDRIHKADLIIGDFISFGSTKDDLIKEFGQPNNESEYYNELDDITMKLLSYDDSKFYLFEGRLVSFDISSSNISLKIQRESISVGSDIENKRSLFPKFFSQSNQASPLRVAFYDHDDWLSIEFDSLTGRISKIAHVFP